MNLTRRDFLGGAMAAVAAAFSWRALAGDGVPDLVFGVLSDPHVTDDPATADVLEKVFAYLRSQNVDVVVISGDITHLGLVSELKLVAKAWDNVFAGVCGAGGEPVKKMFVLGNHDAKQASFQRGKPLSEEERNSSIFSSPKRVWKEVLGEDEFDDGIFMRVIRGFTFVGANWGHEGEIGKWLAAHEDAVKGDRPFFYVQHPHPRGTCLSIKEIAADNGASTKALASFPNCFAMSGHSHRSISDDCALWHGSFASMAAGSSRIVGIRSGYDNSHVKPGPKAKEAHTKTCSAGGAWQVSVVRVHGDRVEVDRRDIKSGGGSLGASWVLSLPLHGCAERPFVCAEKGNAPQFPVGAAVKISTGQGKRRPSNTLEDQIHVKFPAAVSDGPWSRALSYLVEVMDSASGRKLAEREVLQSKYAMPEAVSEKESGFCAFGVDELPSGAMLVFRVTPRNAVARGGRPIEGRFAV